MKIKEFDRSNLAEIRTAITEALAEVGTNFGVTFTPGSCRFDPFTSNWKLTATVNKNGKTVHPFEAEWNRSATLYGFKKSDLGKSFTYFGKKYTIAGVKPRARTRAVICSYGGKFYRFDSHEVQLGLKGEK